jgi:AcrR family transcriptional regulator
MTRMASRPSSGHAHAASSAAGRPRSTAIDAAILRAATALLATVGVDGTTINAVARRSGVARASIYLRYPGRDALLTAAIRSAIGREPIPVTGDLENDFYRGAEQTRAILSSKPFRAVFPRLVAGLLEPRGAPGAITYAMLAPNRALLVDEYRALAGKAGLRTDIDADLVVDLVIGGLLNHLLVIGTVPTRADAEQVVEIVLAGLRVG